MGAELDRLAREKYILLTTFRKNGNPVPTPVWIAADGDDLVVYSEREAGKVKRIRREPRVELTACDARGRSTHGATVGGTARVLHDGALEHVRGLLVRKYGIVGRVFMFFSRLRGGPQRTVGLAIAVDAS